MCGIVGYLAKGQLQLIARAQIQSAVQSLKHRGPDGDDCWFDENLGLGFGHLRLAIQDVSQAARQPMISKDQRWVMVFNGEVYNFAQIRARLEAAGKPVTSTGDSEVILEAIAHWGLDAIDEFVGMFSIALWDRQFLALYLIRDRVGVKPLYYANIANTVIFASELKALQSFSFYDPQIDKSAVGEYLKYGYLSEQTCIFHQTFKVAPGCWVKIDFDGKKTQHRYWSADQISPASSTVNLSDEQWYEHIETLITDSTRLRMVADVPIGVFLSGGIDSSLVAALAQRQTGRRLKTFTIGFDEKTFNEAPYAKEVAKHLGTEHEEFIMPASAALDLLPQWGNLYDEPFGDSSGLPTTLVSRAASKHVKVVLSADGGDELFSGYTRYSILDERGRQLEALPQKLRNFASAVLNRLPLDSWDSTLALRAANGSGNHSLRYQTTWRARMVRQRIGLKTSAQFYDSAQAHFSNTEIEALLNAKPYPRRSCADYPEPAIEQFARWDFEHYLPSDILTKVDRATMSASIEGREPLLDHRLIEAAFSMPLHLKRGTLGPKHILKHILYKYVPQPLVDRPKAGFGVPMTKWLRGPLRALLHETLINGRAQADAILNRNEVMRLVHQFEGGDHTLTTPVWLLLAFELWRAQWATQ
jgi:asparagine synthase (glutamine-hydrolysing)